MIITLKKNKIHTSIFTHIEKCAGMSLCKLLSINQKTHPYDLRYRHRTLSEDLYFLKNKLHENTNIKKIFFFTCFRNPWDRIVSFYHYLKKLKLDKNSFYWSDAYEICKKGTFSDFVLFAKDNYYKTTIFRTYKSRLLYKNNITTDYVMNFHDLNNDIKYLNYIFGIKEKLPKINTSKHKSYKFYYNSNTEEIIRNIFQEDINEFEFSFDKTNQLKKPSINTQKIEFLLSKNVKFL